MKTFRHRVLLGTVALMSLFAAVFLTYANAGSYVIMGTLTAVDLEAGTASVDGQAFQLDPNIFVKINQAGPDFITNALDKLDRFVGRTVEIRMDHQDQIFKLEVQSDNPYNDDPLDALQGTLSAVDLEGMIITIETVHAQTFALHSKVIILVERQQGADKIEKVENLPLYVGRSVDAKLDLDELVFRLTIKCDENSGSCDINAPSSAHPTTEDGDGDGDAGRDGDNDSK